MVGRTAASRFARRSTGAAAEVLTPEALAFVASLQREFGAPSRRAARARARRAGRASQAGELPDFLPETAPSERETGAWRRRRAALRDRRCEITGPVERKMMINALNSGARVFMADFEDANSPTWANCVEGQANCFDAVRRTIALDTPEQELPAERGDGGAARAPARLAPAREARRSSTASPISAGLFDFGLYLYWNGRELLERGLGPYFYLPKLESHLEARLWNDVFCSAQDALGIPRGSIRATVLVETILAAFEMDEILYELREHSGGLNAGRWDYIFSVIKKFRDRPEFVLPDRAQVTMTVPFMRAYTELLVSTCHRRGAHAIGGHGGVHPEPARPRGERDRAREGARGQGARGGRRLRRHLGRPSRPRPGGDRRLRRGARRPPEPARTASATTSRWRPPTSSTSRDTPGEVDGGRAAHERQRRDPLHRVVAARVGAAAIYNLMEDAATAEISPLPGLAVDPARPLHARRGAARHRRGARRRSASWSARRPSTAGGSHRPGGSSSRLRSPTTSPTS